MRYIEHITTPTYKWLKSVINDNGGIDFKYIIPNKSKINLDEFQILYDYIIFIEKNIGTKIANIEMSHSLIRTIKAWVEYLMLIQVFGEEMRSDRRDYTKPYNEISSLPKLTKSFRENKIIMGKVLSDFFYEPKSVTRQFIILFEYSQLIQSIKK